MSRVNEARGSERELVLEIESKKAYRKEYRREGQKDYREP